MAAAFALLGWAAAAGAQPGAPTAPEPPEEIVVTGERVSRSLSETQSSVAVFTAGRIEAEPGADRLDQLLESTPNVLLGTSSLGPTIRGQNTTGVLQDLPGFLGGTRSRVALQVDGRAVGYNEFVFGVAPLWDVEQVEVFRSPQTTTQGRNAIAGAIFVETMDPTYEPEAAARAIGGSRAMRQVSAMASGPLIDGQLAVRIAGDLRQGRPSSDIADLMVGADPDNDDYGLVRVKLLAEPKAAPWLRLEGSFVHAESKSPQVEGVRPPFEERRDPAPGYGVFGNRVDSFTARARVALGDRLQSRTTFAFGDSDFERFAAVGFGQARNAVTDWSLESVLDWQPAESLRLIGGAHHLRTRLDQFIDLTAVLGIGRFDDRQRSTGLFGEASFNPLDRLTVTAGLRHQSDSQRRTGAIGNALAGFPLDYDESFSAWLPKLSVAYDLSPQVTAGALVQRAYNPGGTSINFDTGAPEMFGPERAWSYELFARASAGRARLSANLFHTDFRNAQRANVRAFTVPGGRTAFWAEIENVPRSWSHGAEVSADWQASSRLTLTGGVGLLRTRITRAGDPGNPIDGKQFQRAPHLTLSGAAEWRPLDRLSLGVGARHHSGYFSTDSNDPALAVDEATIVHARAAYAFGRFSLFGYARNLLDTFYMSHLSTPGFGTAVDPRELGIGLETRF